METESFRIMKNLLELENAKFRMNARKSPTKTRYCLGLQPVVYPKLKTGTKSKRLEDLETGWNNAFTKGERSPPAEEPPRKTPDLSSTPTLSSSSSSSQDCIPTTRWTDSRSSSSSSSQDGKQTRRWTDHWKSLKDKDGNWRGKSSDKIESQTQKAMNAKILEAGRYSWNAKESTFRRKKLKEFENAMFKEVSVRLIPLRIGKDGTPQKKTVEDLERGWINSYKGDPPKYPKSSCHGFWDKVMITDKAGYDFEKAKDGVRLRSLEGGWAINCRDHRTKDLVLGFDRPKDVSALDPTHASICKRLPRLLHIDDAKGGEDTC